MNNSLAPNFEGPIGSEVEGITKVYADRAAKKTDKAKGAVPKNARELAKAANDDYDNLIKSLIPVQQSQNTLIQALVKACDANQVSIPTLN